MKAYTVRVATKTDYAWLLTDHHYAKRVPSVSFAYGLFDADRIIGVITFGTPASRELMKSACPTSPDDVIELNRLCVLDGTPRNTESWFIARALKMLPPRIVVSFADTIQGHMGFVYRAANFHYAGWTDMERKSARHDYVVEGKHSRAAFRGGVRNFTHRTPRRPKIRYWIVSGNRREQAALTKKSAWPQLCWQQYPPPTEHRQLKFTRHEGLAARRDIHQPGQQGKFMSLEAAIAALTAAVIENTAAVKAAAGAAPAKAPKPAASTPAAPAAAPAAATGPTQTQVLAILERVKTEKSTDVAKEIVRGHGFKKMVDITPDKFATIYAQCETALSAAPAADDDI